MNIEDIRQGLLVKHKSDPKVYRVAGLGKVNFRGTWVDAIHYFPVYTVDPGFENCFRTVDDFLINFEVLK